MTFQVLLHLYNIMQSTLAFKKQFIQIVTLKNTFNNTDKPGLFSFVKDCECAAVLPELSP